MRAHLGVLDVHAVEDDVVLAAAVGGEDGLQELDRLRRVGHDDLVAEAELGQRLRTSSASGRSRRRAPSGPTRFMAS